MSNLKEVVEVLTNVQSDIRHRCEDLQKVLDEYSIPTSAVAIIERVMAHLDEIANGTGE